MNKQTTEPTPMKQAPPTPVKHTPLPKPVPQGMAHDHDLLNAVFTIQNPSRNRACNNHAMDIIAGLAPKGCTVVRNKGNLLIRKGPNEGLHPHYLAHMDQVHDYQPFMQVLTTGNTLHAIDGNGTQCGVGGDDKCGIYVALRMLHLLPHCTAVFVRDEEVGCLGSSTVPLAWFKNASFVIQADRNNYTMDLIRDTNGMECASDDFIDAVLKLPIVRAAGHTENSGSITDVGELASRGLKVSMINISSGYHHAHTAREIVKLDELSVTLQLAYEAGTMLGDTYWKHKPTSSWGDYGYGAYGRSKGASFGAGGWSDEGVYTPTAYEKTYFGKLDAGTLFTADEADEEAERQQLIDMMVHDFGFDRDFDNLDAFSYDELADWIDELEREQLTDLDEDADDDDVDDATAYADIEDADFHPPTH